MIPNVGSRQDDDQINARLQRFGTVTSVRCCCCGALRCDAQVAICFECCNRLEAVLGDAGNVAEDQTEANQRSCKTRQAGLQNN
jgi:hypothetical protein